MDTDAVNIEKDSIYKRWLEITRKPETRRVRAIAIRRFCNFVGKTPSKLMKEREREIVSKNREVKMTQENKLRDFYWKLKSDKLSPYSLATYWDAVRSLYRAYFENKNDPGRLAITMPEQPYLTLTYQTPNHEQLRKMVETCENPVHQAYILCQKDCGLSINELISIKWNHNLDEKGVSKSPYGTLWEQLEAKRQIIHLAIFRKKENIEHSTLLGPESVESLHVLRKKFNRKGRKNGLNLDSLVFDVSKRTVAKIVHDAGERVKIVTRPHMLRKFFITNTQIGFMRQSKSGITPGAQADIVDYWAGHKLAGVRGHYFTPPPDMQIEIYESVYPWLKIFK